jgi:GTPase SAR1 family protein
MAYVNWVTYEAQLKVVYYGPAYAGKTTSLRYLSLRLETDVKELPTTDDRSVFFEYAQSQKLPANQLEVKFLYWTLPGQQKYRRTRHLVLAATDAVVFVADSQYQAASMNLEMLNDLKNFYPIVGCAWKEDRIWLFSKFLLSSFTTSGICPISCRFSTWTLSSECTPGRRRVLSVRRRRVKMLSEPRMLRQRSH